MQDIHQKLLELFDPELEEELCGLIDSNGLIHHAPNVHPEPTKGFRMHAVTLLDLMTRLEIVATWHTHPEGDATLSQEDYAGFTQWSDLTHYIVANDEVRSYVVEDGLVLPA